MKRSWMAIVLLLSVGVNIGVLATLGVSRVRDREPEWRESRRPQGPRGVPSADRLADRLGLEGASREAFLEQHRRFFDTVGRVRSELSETRRTLRQEVALPAPDEERIAALLGAYVRFALDNPELTRGALLGVRPRNAPFTDPQPPETMPFFRCLSEAVLEGQERGQVRDGDPTLIAHGLWAAVHGSVGLPINMPRHRLASSEAIATAAIDLVLRGLAPDGHGAQ